MGLIGATKKWIGLSTDIKPDGNVGDRFYETDTKDWYVYDISWISTGREELICN